MINFKLFNRTAAYAIYSFFFLGLLIPLNLFSQLDDLEEEDAAIYEGMTTCKCFIHCSCLQNCLSVANLLGPRVHPSKAIDKAWHAFIAGILTAKKEGPFFDFDSLALENFVGIRRYDLIHSMAEYVHLLKKFRIKIAYAREENCIATIFLDTNLH